MVLVFTLDVSVVIAEARDEEALLVLVLIEETAPVTSDCNARVPDESVPAVRVRAPKLQMSEALMPEARVICLPVVPATVSVEVATFQTSAAKLPKFVRVRVPAAQTAVGMVDASEVEAVKTVASV